MDDELVSNSCMAPMNKQDLSGEQGSHIRSKELRMRATWASGLATDNDLLPDYAAGYFWRRSP
eukprot:scaffold44895_cov18-Prasinocladus_malaysianus.AAC.3